MVRSDREGTNPDLESLQAGCSDSGLRKGREKKKLYTEHTEQIDALLQTGQTRYCKFIQTHTSAYKTQTSEDMKWTTHNDTSAAYIYIYAEKLTPVSALFGGIYNSALKTADRQPICHWPVHSILEYSAMVWDPYLQKDNDHLESVQHHAPAYQTGLPIETPRPTAMLKDLELPPLAERRERQRLI